MLRCKRFHRRLPTRPSSQFLRRRPLHLSSIHRAIRLFLQRMIPHPWPRPTHGQIHRLRLRMHRHIRRSLQPMIPHPCNRPGHGRTHQPPLLRRPNRRNLPRSLPHSTPHRWPRLPRLGPIHLCPLLQFRPLYRPRALRRALPMSRRSPLKYRLGQQWSWGAPLLQTRHLTQWGKRRQVLSPLLPPTLQSHHR